MSTSTAYHPQTDGQMERVNQELEQYLQLFINQQQDDWVDLLPMAEFQYNNHIHSATQTTPFLLNTGQYPQMGFEVHAPSKVEKVNKFLGCIKSTSEEACSTIAKAKNDMVHYYNHRCTPAPEFQPGDKVFIDASNICTNRLLDKLAHRYLGPYPIAEKVRRHAYRLQLPHSILRLHLVFNVVKLLAAPKDLIQGRHSEPPLEPALIDKVGNKEYKIEEILDSQMYWRKLQFLVCWKGYGYEEHSWVNKDDIHMQEIINEFYQLNPGAPHWIRIVRASRFPL